MRHFGCGFLGFLQQLRNAAAKASIQFFLHWPLGKTPVREKKRSGYPNLLNYVPFHF